MYIKYQKNTRLLEPFGIGIVHEPAKSLLLTLWQTKRRNDKRETDHQQNKLSKCEKYRTGQGGRLLYLCLHGHRLAVKLNDISLLISIHVNKCGHTFN